MSLKLVGVADDTKGNYTLVRKLALTVRDLDTKIAKASRDFGREDLSDEDFDGVDLVGANFDGTILTRATFEKADLAGANFNDTKLSGAIFDGANLMRATFVNADLSQADFTGATLIDATFLWCNLHRTNFADANAEGASFNLVTWDGSPWCSASQDTLRHVRGEPRRQMILVSDDGFQEVRSVELLGDNVAREIAQQWWLDGDWGDSSLPDVTIRAMDGEVWNFESPSQD